MRIAVSATGGSLDAQIDPRFGRCQYFVIVDTETLNFETLQNTAAGAMGGAGILAAQTVANKGVQAVLTGSIGPNAFQALSAAGINILTSVFGTVKEAVEKFKEGQLQETIAPTATMGFGMGGGYGMGMGGRGGRGMGRGMGRGYWQATSPFTQAQTSPTIRSTPPQLSKEQEVEMLENQMKNIQKQLDQIKKRLRELKE